MIAIGVGDSICCRAVRRRTRGDWARRSINVCPTSRVGSIRRDRHFTARCYIRSTGIALVPVLVVVRVVRVLDHVAGLAVNIVQVGVRATVHMGTRLLVIVVGMRAIVQTDVATAMVHVCFLLALFICRCCRLLQVRHVHQRELLRWVLAHTCAVSISVHAV